MKRIHLYLALCLAILFFASCKKLERNNPLDANGTSTNKTGTNGTTSGPNISFSRYTVSSDDNNDGIINKGESIELNLYLKNTGSSQANGVRATISSSSSYVSSLSPSTDFGFYKYGSSSYDYIQDGSEGSPAYPTQTFKFNVSSSTPVGSVITFNVSITDGNNNTWTSSFTITVQAIGASIGFSRYTVASDNNNDGIINKGESIELNLYLKNTGSSQANGIRATITSSSSYVSSLSPSTAFGFYKYGSSSYDYIQAGSEGSPAYPTQTFNFNVSSLTPKGTVITFHLSVKDESNNTWSNTFTITVQ